MKFTYKIYVVSDTLGYKQAAVSEEGSDMVFFEGFKGNQGGVVSFEAEAYHLERWCKDKGLTLKVVDREIEV